jgi:hypothetical protein
MRIQNLALVAALSLTVACKPNTFTGESPYLSGGENDKSPASPPSKYNEPSTLPQVATQPVQQTQPAQTQNTTQPQNGHGDLGTADANNKSSGSNPWPWIIGGVAAAGVVAAIVAGGGAHCDDAAITQPKAGDPSSPQHLQPFDLANAAYRGGICWGGYDAFCSRYRTTGTPEDAVIEAAIKLGKVDRRQANCAYRSNVEWQISAQCR